MKTLHEEIEHWYCNWNSLSDTEIGELDSITYGAVSRSQMEALYRKIAEKHLNQRTLAEKAMTEGRAEDAAFHSGLAWAYTAAEVDISNLMEAAKGEDA